MSQPSGSNVPISVPQAQHRPDAAEPAEEISPETARKATEAAAAAADALETSQRLHLLQHPTIMASIMRFWQYLAPVEMGTGIYGGQRVLKEAGYVKLNVAFQKALVPNFNAQEAFASAQQDWHEDAKNGGMSKEQFYYFLFELCLTKNMFSHNRARGTVRKNKHCSTRSNEWNSACF